MEAESRSDGAPLVELVRFLSSRGSDRELLMSAEALSYCLYPEKSQKALLRCLEALRSACEVRCVWTLRRIDDLTASLYLLQLSRGARLPSPEDYFDLAQELDLRFAGMRRVAATVGDEAAYVRYAEDGSHLAELLPALGVPEPLRSELSAELAAASRLNSALTQKQAIALLHLDDLAERAAAPLDLEALREAIYRGRLRLDGDRRCELVGSAVRRGLHERALAAAERQGFDAYLDFYAEEEVEATAPVPLGAELIAAADLERIVAVAAPADSGNARDSG